MKRRKLSHKEEDKLAKVLRENEKLKRTVSTLRKQLSRLDIDRYQNLKEILESQDIFEKTTSKKDELKSLKEKWICHGCKQDYLRLIMIPRLDGLFYIRKCPSCHHKTKLKKYTEGVEGITDDKASMAKN